MTDSKARPAHLVDMSRLPPDFPVHCHPQEFWAELGKVVATFGFLEQTLGKAIFAVTATTEYSEDAVGEALAKWGVTLEKALTDALGAKINAYEKAIKANARVEMENPDDLIADLKKAAEVRNVLCHGSWNPPDENGFSAPFFVDRKLRRFETRVDLAYLTQVRRHVTDLIVAVINSVTLAGWQFPGSTGPGDPIWTKGRP